MIAHIKGLITHIQSDSCIVDVHGVGYQLFVARPYDYKVQEEKIFFTYHHIREDIQALYGFDTMEEKSLYLRLLSVKGVGPRVAMTMIAATSPDMLIHAIEKEDVSYLKKIPGIGPKAASQIILDLRGKLTSDAKPLVNEQSQEAIDALNALGYTKKEIDFALKTIDVKTLRVEAIIKQALKNLMG